MNDTTMDKATCYDADAPTPMATMNPNCKPMDKDTCYAAAAESWDAAAAAYRRAAYHEEAGQPEHAELARHTARRCEEHAERYERWAALAPE